MKFIFRIIKLLILVITLMPFILLAIMYKGYDLPVNDFVVEEEMSFTDIASYKLDNFLMNEQAQTFDFTFDKNTANVALKDLYAKDNDAFMSTDESIPYGDRLYAIKLGNYGGFKGANVEFYDGGLMIVAGGEVGFNKIFYKTTVTIKLELDIDAHTLSDDTTQTQIKLAVKELNIGNLPVFWMYDGANWVVEKILGKSVNTLIQETVSGIGNFDLDTRTVIITSDDILKFLNEANDDNHMMNALFGMIDELELLESHFDETQGGIKIELGKLRTSQTGYQLTHSLENDSDVERLFKGQLSSLLVSALTFEDHLTYNMHEMAFNQLIDYYVKDSMNISEEINIGEHKYLVETEPLFGIFKNNEVHFNIILKLRKEDDQSKVFKTNFILKTTPHISEDKRDLEFEIKGLGIGDNEEISLDTLSSILALIGENEMIVGNKIILKEFLDEFKTQNVEVNSISVNGKYLEFKLKPTGTNLIVLAALQNEISNVLADVLENPQYSDILEAYDIENPDVNVIVDAINGLDNELQAELFNTLLTSLSDIPNLGNLIP